MNTIHNHLICRIRQQRGSVLMTGIIFLLILTMIVLSMLSTGTLEERMAANDRDRLVALQAADAVMRDAADSLASPTFWENNKNAFTSDCTNGFCTRPANDAKPNWQTVNWSDAEKTRTFAAATSNLPGLTSQPKYIFEFVRSPGEGATCRPGIFNVTAQGIGVYGAEVFLQGTYEVYPLGC